MSILTITYMVTWILLCPGHCANTCLLLQFYRVSQVSRAHLSLLFPCLPRGHSCDEEKVQPQTMVKGDFYCGQNFRQYLSHCREVRNRAFEMTSNSKHPVGLALMESHP